jgi:hypothetical protein
LSELSFCSPYVPENSITTAWSDRQIYSCGASGITDFAVRKYHFQWSVVNNKKNRTHLADSQFGVVQWERLAEHLSPAACGNRTGVEYAISFISTAQDGDQ